LKGQAAVGVGSLEAPSSERKRLAALYASPRILSLSITHFLAQRECSRSRDWVCPRCNRSNLESLPDPPQTNDAASGPTSEVKTSSEAEAISTPAESNPVQPAENEAPVPTRAVAENGVDGASEVRGNEVTTPVAASSLPSTSTPLSNSQSVRSARQAGTAPAFQPSHTPTTVRPPMLLDTAICVLLVLVFALLCRRVF
jgi:ubiquitin-conjugating enzyme E2 J1